MAIGFFGANNGQTEANIMKLKEYAETLKRLPTDWLLMCYQKPSKQMKSTHIQLVLLELNRRGAIKQ